MKFLAECSRRTRCLLDEAEPRLFEHLIDERVHLREMVKVAVSTGMRKDETAKVVSMGR